MSRLPKLNFPAIRLRARRRGDGVEVWDSLRGIYLVLTPEEWVRQHLIAYLTAYCGVQPKRIVQEYAVALNGQPQRADVVVVGDRAEPLLLAECKAPCIPINGRTLAQAVRYNSVLGARYVILTNGLRHYCCECRDGEYVQLGGFPDLSGDWPSVFPGRFPPPQPFPQPFPRPFSLYSAVLISARPDRYKFRKFLSIYPWKASL